MTVVKLMKIYKFNNKKVLHTNCYPIEYTYSYKSILHYNSLSSLLVDIVLFGFTLLGFPSIGRGFHTLIKDVSLTSPIPPPPLGASILAGSFLSPIDVGPHQIHLLWSPASLLAHRFMSTPGPQTQPHR